MPRRGRRRGERKGKTSATGLAAVIEVIWALIKEYLTDQELTRVASTNQAFRKEHGVVHLEVEIDQNAFETALDRIDLQKLHKITLSRPWTVRRVARALAQDGPFETQGRRNKQLRNAKRKKDREEKLRLQMPRERIAGSRSGTDSYYPEAFREVDAKKLEPHPWGEPALFDLTRLRECPHLKNLDLARQAHDVHVQALKTIIELRQLWHLRLHLYEWTLDEVGLENLGALTQLRTLLLDFDDNSLKPDAFAAICSLPALRELGLTFGWMKETSKAWHAHAPLLRLEKFSFWLSVTDGVTMLPVYFAEQLRWFETYDAATFDLTNCVNLEHLRVTQGNVPVFEKLRYLSANSLHTECVAHFWSLAEVNLNRFTPPHGELSSDSLQKIHLHGMLDLTAAYFAKVPNLQTLTLSGVSSVPEEDLQLLHARGVTVPENGAQIKPAFRVVR